jgi:hypothetical protein
MCNKGLLLVLSRHVDLEALVLIPLQENLAGILASQKESQRREAVTEGRNSKTSFSFPKSLESGSKSALTSIGWPACFMKKFP